jgi:hypothetical protein
MRNTMGFQPKHVLGFDPRKVVAAAIKAGFVTAPPEPPAPKLSAHGQPCRRTGPAVRYSTADVDRVHHLRHEHGLTYKVISKMTGFPMNSLAWMLHGINPSAEMAAKLTKKKLGK